MINLEARKAEIAEKQEILAKARHTLKEEFVGIDRVIDEVVDSINSWYLFPEIQEKPLVINLWGLTGVGKTSLVKRLSALLSFEKQFYHFDLGEENKHHSELKNNMENIFENEGGYPIILALDEFQHARTLNESGFEISDSRHRIVWQLLDTGRFFIQNGSLWVFDVYKLMGNLNQYLLAGITVANGLVISRIETFRQMRDQLEGITYTAEDAEESNEDALFISTVYWTKILELAPKMFESMLDMKSQFLKQDGPGTIKLLRAVIKEAYAPKEVDCSQGLIFVMGNLDEAYHMSGNQNADISADAFHLESLKINTPKIKKALKKRFRNEHIARLGNHHIIYPALSRQSFEQIIELELSKFALKANDYFGTRLCFHPNLRELLYSEGVYPTQGTRPLLTTIYQLVQSRLGNVISEMHTHHLMDCSVQFEAHSHGILARFLRNEETCHTLLFEQDFELKKLRKEKRDDRQAITAVHESGHAILSAVLLHTVPKIVCSITSESSAHGFAQIEHAWEYTAKRELIPRMGILLGGLMAEKVIFGEEHITDGNASDIQRATSLITTAIKEEGMGSIAANFDVEAPGFSGSLYDSDYELNREARSLLSQAAELAEKTLREQETLLIHMANYLSDYRELQQDAIINLLKAHAVNFDVGSLIFDGDQRYYRKHLKAKVREQLSNMNHHKVLEEAVLLNGNGR